MKKEQNKQEERVLKLKVAISVILSFLLLLLFDLLSDDSSKTLNMVLSILPFFALLLFAGLGIAFLLIFPPLLSKSKNDEEKNDTKR